jgi:hypothetical protein
LSLDVRHCLERICGAGDLACRIGQRLALLAGDNGREVVRVVAHASGELVQVFSALSERVRAPFAKCLARGGDGAVELLGGGVRTVGERRRGRGVDDLEGALAAFTAAVDRMRGCALGVGEIAQAFQSSRHGGSPFVVVATIYSTQYSV